MDEMRKAIVGLAFLKMKKIVSILFVLALAAGCRAQVPPATTWVVNLTGDAGEIPTGSNLSPCTAALPCCYEIFRAAGPTLDLSPSACGGMYSDRLAADHQFGNHRRRVGHSEGIDGERRLANLMHGRGVDGSGFAGYGDVQYVGKSDRNTEFYRDVPLLGMEDGFRFLPARAYKVAGP